MLFYCSWYDEHLKECEGSINEELRIRIVLLTNDKENREKAKKEGIVSFTGNQFDERCTAGLAVKPEKIFEGKTTFFLNVMFFLQGSHSLRFFSAHLHSGENDALI